MWDIVPIIMLQQNQCGCETSGETILCNIYINVKSLLSDNLPAAHTCVSDIGYSFVSRHNENTDFCIHVSHYKHPVMSSELRVSTWNLVSFHPSHGLVLTISFLPSVCLPLVKYNLHSVNYSRVNNTGSPTKERFYAQQAQFEWL